MTAPEQLLAARKILGGGNPDEIRRLRENTTDPALHSFLDAQEHLKSANTAAALHDLEKAVQSSPNVTFYVAQHAKLAFECGLKDKALQSFQRCLKLDPGDATAARMIAWLWEYPKPEFREAIENCLKTTAGEKGRKHIEALFAAAKLSLDLGQFDQGFAHLAAAGVLQKQAHPWSPDGLKKIVAALAVKCTKSWMQSVADQGFNELRPIFIIGMPRSGTTLVESILSAHPQIVSIGESFAAENALNGVLANGTRFETSRRKGKFLTPLTARPTLSQRGAAYATQAKLKAPGAIRVVDKFPGNYLWLGLIHAILPQAKFIHCMRHPADAALSQYIQYFANELPYSYDLEDLAEAFKAYNSIMHHWNRVVPRSAILNLPYETLVRNFVPMVRQLLEFCELDWFEACLQPHMAGSRFQTASAVQIRQPVNDRSIGKWKKYEMQMLQFLNAAREMVDSYEAHGHGSPFDPIYVASN